MVKNKKELDEFMNLLENSLDGLCDEDFDECTEVVRVGMILELAGVAGLEGSK